MTTPAPFPFPREYSFPPFFTRQTNLTTHHAQLVKWSDLILAYCRHNRIFKLSLNAAIPSAPTAALPYALPNTSTPSIAITDPTLGGTSASSSGAAGPEELFHNKTLNKRLSLADAREVLEFMKKDGRAEQLPASPEVFWVYWRTPDEWAAAIEAWIDETAQKGVVLTLYELTEGEGTRGTGECFLGVSYDMEGFNTNGRFLQISTASIPIYCKKRCRSWSSEARLKSLERRTPRVSSSSDYRSTIRRHDVAILPFDSLEDVTTFIHYTSVYLRILPQRSTPAIPTTAPTPTKDGVSTSRCNDLQLLARAGGYYVQERSNIQQNIMTFRKSS